MKINSLNNLEVKKYNHCQELLFELSKIAFDKSVFKELGYPIFSDENHTWFLIYKNNNLIGFCASIKKQSHISFNHDYIIKSERNKGHYHILFYERLKNNSGIIKSVTTKKSISKFIEFGFEIEKETKNYTFVKLKK